MIVRNVFSNWTGFLITGLIGLLLTPFLIRELGVLHFGIWVLVSTVVDYYSLLDIWIRTTLQRYVARFTGSGEREALNQTFATAFALALNVVAAILVITALLVVVLPAFFNVPESSKGLFVQTMGLLAVSFSVSLLARLFGAYLCGYQRFDLYNLAAVSVALLRAGLIVGALIEGYGIVGVAGAALTAAVFSLGLHVFLVRRIDSQVCFSPWTASWARAKELVRFGVFVFLNAVGDYLRFYTDSVVIGKVLGLTFIAPYNVAFRLVDYYRQLIISMVGPLLPAMSGLDGTHRHKELRELFLRYTRLAALLSLFLGLILMFDGHAILVVWLGEEFVRTHAPYPILLILVTGFVIALLQSPSGVLLQAVGRHQLMGIWTISEGIVKVVLSIYLARQYGLQGVAWGTVVPMIVVRVLIQPWYTLYVAGVSASDYVFKSLVRPLVVGEIFALACLLVPKPAAFPHFLQLLGTLTWQLALFGLLAYWIGLDADDRDGLRVRVGKLAATIRRVSWEG